MDVPYDSSVKTICVGNAIVGGGGKTPTAIYIAQYLKASKRFKKIGFLSRGYGGTIKKPTLLLKKHTAAEVGDEPIILSQYAPVIISKDKKAGLYFAEEQGFDCIIMDDGYQNTSVFRDIHILVIDKRGFGNGQQLPAGPLRESALAAIEKADIIIATEKLDTKLNANKTPFFEGYYAPAEKIKPQSVYAFAGIANPKKFKGTLEQNGFEIKGFESFSDHQVFDPQTLQRLQKEAKNQDAILITTEKDHVRLPKNWQKKIEYLPITLVIENEKKLYDTLDRLL